MLPYDADNGCALCCRREVASFLSLNLRVNPKDGRGCRSGRGRNNPRGRGGGGNGGKGGKGEGGDQLHEDGHHPPQSRLIMEGLRPLNELHEGR